MSLLIEVIETMHDGVICIVKTAAYSRKLHLSYEKKRKLYEN